MAPVLSKSLSRLSRDALIDLCLEWTQSKHSVPYLTSNRNLIECDDEDYLHEPAHDRDLLRSFYEDIKQQIVTGAGKDSLSKREVIDRIVDGDWRRGLSLHQLATIDFSYLEENDAALRWSALKLVPLKSNEDASSHPAKKRKLTESATKHPDYPQMEPTCFLNNLKRQISPLIRAHYTMRRLRSSNLTVLRLYIVPMSAFAPSKSAIPKSPKQATDAARVMFIALPDSCAHVYVSLSGATAAKTLADPKTSTKTKVDINATKRIILEAIPKAFSRPQERWGLENTKLTTKSLRSMVLLRGNTRPGTAGGAYARFSDEYTNANTPEESGQQNEMDAEVKGIHERPSQIQCPTPPPEEISRLEIDVNRRFGRTAGSSHAPLNRVHVKIENILSPAPYMLGSGKDKVSRTKHTTSKNSSGGKKRKRLSLEEIERGDYRNRRQVSPTDESELDTSSSSSSQQPASMTITFSGMDVVAGLRQLALLGDQHIDLDRMPAWVTGEKGVTGLTV